MKKYLIDYGYNHIEICIINLLKLILFVILILKFTQLKIKEHPFYLAIRKPIIEKNKEKKKSLIKGRIYLNQCLNGSNHYQYYSKRNPKVTAIIPIFNSEKTIEASLLSIQNQNLTKIEIILINDFSKDNTSEIINDKQRKDHRIKIINNHRNMGTLYSRSIGALMAKGKYIFCLDNDDMFFDEDIFDFFYKKGKNENLDIIGFQTVNLWNYSHGIEDMRDLYTYQYPNEYFVKQPELGRWMVTFEGKFLVHNNMIWDKSIKTSIYQKAVNLIGEKRYSNYLIWAEDTCINFIIFNLAESFKYIHKYGILHFKSTKTASFIQPIEHKLYGEVFFLDVIFEFSKNNTDKNLAVEQILFMEKQFNLNNNYNNPNYVKLKSIIRNILKCQYIYTINKRKVKKIFKNYLIHLF